MFPNVRLLVVAVLAAIAGIGCGLGLFATFRVNHEPLARLAEGGAPLQLALNNLVSPADARLPFDARLPVNGETKPVSAPVIVAPPSASSDRAEASAAPGAAKSDQETGVAAENDRANLASAPAEDQKNEVSLTAPLPTEPSAGKSEGVEIAQRPQNTAALSEPEANSEPNDATASAVTEATASAVSDVAAAQSEPAHPAAENQKSTDKSTKARKAAKVQVRTVRATAPARHTAKTVRVRRTTVAAQPANQFPLATYQWPDTQVTQPAQPTQPARLVVVKRHRVVKRTPPAAPQPTQQQSTQQLSPSAVTAGMAGGQ